MHDATDMDLLRQYAGGNSDAAFAALVSRHVDLVYSAALRKTGNLHAAEEITQAVFIILAQKAGRILDKTILPGWLYQTARLTASSFLRGETRRVRREQEAFMQTEPYTVAPDETWEQLAPLLEDAMGQLGDQDRAAVVLRFFGGKSFAEVATAAGVSENAAKKRVSHALEKLHRYFTKRGVSSTTAIIAGAISTHSVQAAPVALAKSVTAVAVAKGAAASGSTLTLIKGALKIMAWTKAKTAIVAGASVLLVAGTATITIKEIQKERPSLWALPNFDPVPVVAPAVLGKTPPQVRIVSSKYDHRVVGPFTQGDAFKFVDGKWVPSSTNASQSMGVGVTLGDIVKIAYGSDSLRTAFDVELPGGRYDYIANLRQNALKILQQQIQEEFGLIGRREMRETDVLVLELSNPEVRGFKPAGSLLRSMNVTNMDVNSPEFARGEGRLVQTQNASIETRFNTPVEMLRGELENTFQLPIIDETGLTNRYDYSMIWPVQRTPDNEAHRESVKQVLRDQLGLELVSSRKPIEMLVVEKVK